MVKWLLWEVIILKEKYGNPGKNQGANIPELLKRHTPKAIHNKAHKLGLKYDFKEYDIPEDELIDLYNTKKMTQEKIAKHFNCSRWVIAEQLKKLREKVEYRNRETSIGLNPKYLKSINLDSETQQILEGALLSDGHISYRPRNRQKKTARIIIKQTKKDHRREWLEFIQHHLKKNKLKSKIFPVKEHMRGKTHAEYSLQTESTTNLKNEWKRWYLEDICFCVHCEIAFNEKMIKRTKWKHDRTCPVCNKHELLKKIIPKDIELTPIVIAHWLMGDGNTNPSRVDKKKGKKYYRIQFHTEGFLKNDNEMLKNKLNDKYGYNFRLKPYSKENKNVCLVINNHQDEIKSFLEMTKKYKISCFAYKWRALDDPLFGIDRIKWTEQDKEILCRDYPKLGSNIPELKERGHKMHQIQQMAQKLGVKCDYIFNQFGKTKKKK